MNPVKAAYRAVALARSRGDLVPGPCEQAGPDCKGYICAHHEDYRKPLDVRWFCSRHHRLHHAWDVAARRQS